MNRSLANKPSLVEPTETTIPEASKIFKNFKLSLSDAPGLAKHAFVDCSTDIASMMLRRSMIANLCWRRQNTTMGLLFGISHLFGETDSFEAIEEFYGAYGFVRKLRLRLPAPNSKLVLMPGIHELRECEMLLLRHPQIPIGLEFLQHAPRFQPKTSGPSAIPHVQFGTPPFEELVDPDGNRIGIGENPHEKAFIKIQCAQRVLAIETFAKLGFKLEKDVLTFHHPLFSSLRLDIQLIENKDFRPQMNVLGFSGISLLVNSLEKASSRHALLAPQEFIGFENRKSKVSFCIEGGSLLEFLELGRKP